MPSGLIGETLTRQLRSTGSATAICPRLELQTCSGWQLLRCVWSCQCPESACTQLLHVIDCTEVYCASLDPEWAATVRGGPIVLVGTVTENSLGSVWESHKNLD